MARDEFSDLVARAKAGDRKAFEDLVRGTYEKVHGLALRLTGNEHDADDVVQDTYVRAFNGLRRFRGDARFSTWLHRITANSASNLLSRRSRHRRRHHDLDEVVELADHRPEHDPALNAEIAATGSRLERALDHLPSRLRNVVVLRDLHGMSHREIAEELDITESAAKVRLHRARIRLRELLSPTIGEVTESPADLDSEGDDAVVLDFDQTRRNAS